MSCPQRVTLYESPTREIYKVTKILGRGAFGTVSQVRRESDGSMFAVKEIELSTELRLKEAATIVEDHLPGQREIRILTRLSRISPNIVTLIEAWRSEDGGSMNIVMECVDGGRLREILDEYRKEGRRLPLDTTKRWLMQLAMGMAVIHSHNIVHRDIKPSNILLTSDQNLIKIADLGLARDEAAGSTISRTSIAGTISYCSPEELDEVPATSRSDMYSLGCVLYEMISWTKAFQGPFIAIAKNIATGSFQRLVPESTLDSELIDLCHRLMLYEPTGRPTALEILTTPCLQAYVREYLKQYPAMTLRFPILDTQSQLKGVIGTTSTEAYSTNGSPQKKTLKDQFSTLQHLEGEWFTAYGSKIIIGADDWVKIEELPGQKLQLKLDAKTGEWVLDGEDSHGERVTWKLNEEESHADKACWKRGDGFLSRKMVWIRRQSAEPLPGGRFFSALRPAITPTATEVLADDKKYSTSPSARA